MSGSNTLKLISVSEDTEGSSYRPDKRLSIDFYNEAIRGDSICSEVRSLSEIEFRYVEKVPLGRGALKEVFKCFDLRTKRYIALANPAENLGVEFHDLFLQEAWLTSSLSHPNIIKVYDTGVTEQGLPFFTMDLKRNTTLKSLKEKNNDLKVLLNGFLKICDALSYAHSKGIIHMDLKPENIQWDRFGEVLVCDWGLAKKIGEEETGEQPTTEHLRETQHVTLFGEIRGTLGYMAPEQVVPEGEKTRSTDIFALGCLFHFILLGKAPFTGSKKEIIDKTIEADLRKAVQEFKALKLPQSLSAILRKALQAKPENRYLDVDQLRDDVERFLHGFATRAELPGLFRQSGLFLMRHKRSVMITLTSLILIVGLSGLYWSSLVEKESRLTEEKARFESLVQEVEVLTDEYGVFQDLPDWSKDKIRASLVEDSVIFRRLFWMGDPVAAVRKNHNLLNKIYVMQPDSPNLIGYLCRADYYMMNFKSVLSYPPSGSPYQENSARFASLCPNYDFTESDRPTIKELCRFYERAGNDESISRSVGFAPKLYAVMKYDWAVREDRKNYYQVVAALLRTLNSSSVIESRSNEDQLSQLLISSKSPFESSFELEQKRYKVFRYLEVGYLKLNVDEFALSELDNAKIHYLDLTGVKVLDLSYELYIKGLKEVVVPDSVSPKLLRKVLKSDQHFKIKVPKS